MPNEPLYELPNGAAVELSLVCSIHPYLPTNGDCPTVYLTYRSGGGSMILCDTNEKAVALAKQITDAVNASRRGPTVETAGKVRVLAGVGRDEDGNLRAYGGANVSREEIIDWFAGCDYCDPHAYLTAMVDPAPVVAEITRG